MGKSKILIADDDKNIQFAFRKTFEKDGFEVITANDGREVLDKLLSDPPEVIFMDVTMPKMSGLETLEEIKKRGFAIPVVIITGYGTMQTAVKAVQLGAYEYVTKPLDIDKIRVLAQRALEMVRLRDEVENLRSQLDAPTNELEIVGKHPKMQEVFKTIGAVTATPNSTNVLIFGESGTGKELVARAIHNLGPKGNRPFVAINCTVLPENLLESELFGHEKGAFTGATERKMGKFEIAGDGTLFLDEIGDMSVNLQQKLLRVLQQREFERLGGHGVIPVKARFIAATNKDLEKRIKSGNFREDLYFRLNVISLRIPQLRDRKDDIPLLAEYFLNKYSRQLNKPLKKIAQQVIERLMTLDYPGNVRELENIIEHCVAMEKGNVLTTSALPSYLTRTSGQATFDMSIADKNLKRARRSAIEAFEKQFVQKRLKVSRGNVSAAAREAGIERQSFQRLMKKYGIRSADFRR